MCKKPKGVHNKIDKCMKPLIKFLNRIDIETYGSCCGHGKYPMTIVSMGHLDGKECYYELLTGIDIPRRRRFYKKDKQNYYFIPEIIEEKR